ncbi:MAG: hypothetical protein E7653_00170 [Ruminococcaceae bacterium]|nr:hypothetical protein [Oscillospiraceae bacterium]
MKKTVKIISVLFAVLILLLSCPLSAFALDYGLIDVSDVCADLKEFKINITDYPKDPDSEHIRLLYFLEYGYDYYGGTADYDIYLYLYNPTGEEIDVTSGKNYIQMQFLNSAGTSGSGFRKLKLKLVNYSTVQGYEHVFYKFKIEGIKDFHSKLEKGMRQYDISGIEIKHKSDTKATDYEVGGVYTVTGYMPYHDVSRTSENTLKTYIRDRITVDLDLHTVSWKTKTSDKGVGYQYEVFSVYFSVPNDIINDYGNKDDLTKGLKEIDGSFEEYKVNGLVTSKANLHTKLEQYVGKKAGDSVPFRFADYSHGTSNTSKNTHNFCYNVGCDNCKNIIPWYSTVVYDTNGVFYNISNNSLMNELYINDNEEFYILPEVDAGCTQGFQYYNVKSETDLAEKIGTYASTTSAFVAWLKGETKLYNATEVYDEIKAIEYVDPKIWNYSNSWVSDNYYVLESEAADLKKFAVAEAAKGNSTFIMRFAVRDYFNSPVSISDGGFWALMQDAFVGTSYFEKTVFIDLDVLSFTWENQYNQRTVIPVNCDPINHVGSVTPPADGSDPNQPPGGGGGDKSAINGCQDLNSFWIVIIFLVVIVIFIILWRFAGPFITSLLGGLGKVVSATFNGALKLGAFVVDSAGKRKDNKNKKERLNLDKRKADTDEEASRLDMDMKHQKSKDDHRRANDEHRRAQDIHDQELYNQRRRAEAEAERAKKDSE